MKSHSPHKIHLLDFLILITILLVGATLIFVFNSNKTYQKLSIIGLSISYFLWGVIHHFKSQSHHWRIALEYLLVSSLGGSILWMLILNA